MWKRSPGVEFKYKGKRYFFNFVWTGSQGLDKIRPINEPENKLAEVTVKDYKVGGWNVTVNVNGEIIVVGWGSGKHLVVWGSIWGVIALSIVIIRKKKKWRWKPK